MTKRINAKHKIDRRLGVNVWGSAKSPFSKKNYGPGQHGAQRSKPTDYGTQLRAKQLLKGYYGNMNERQFRRVYEEAARMHGDTNQNMIGLLESRLDAIVYRLKFAQTVFAARQLVNHGHVRVNGKRLNIGSARLREGDEITVTLQDNSKVLEAISSKEREVPPYFEVDHGAMKGKFARIPQLQDVPYPVQMHPHLVIEFYSR